MTPSRLTTCARPGPGLRIVLAWALLQCGSLAGQVTRAATPPPAAEDARATVLLERSRVGVGEIFEVVAIVRIAATERVHLSPPELPPGLELVSRETLPPERIRDPGEDRRDAEPSARSHTRPDAVPAEWLARTRFRVRALEAGTHRWPALSITLETAEDRVSQLSLPPRPVTVQSILDEFPPGQAPFGVRRPVVEPAGASGPGSALWGAAWGAAGTLVLMSALLYLRRPRRGRGADEPSVSPDERAEPDLPWTARSLLDRAHRELEGDPRLAANLGARALRRFSAEHFGADITARTSDELAALRPIHVAAPLWQALIDLLRRYDDERFQPAREGARPIDTRRVEACLEATERYFLEQRSERAGRTS